MATDLRCPSYKLHARLVGGLIEVQCRDKRCGYEAGVVILHQFNPDTGELVKTLKFNDPPRKGETANGSSSRHSALRSA